MEVPTKLRSLLAGFRYWLLALMFMAISSVLVSCGGGGTTVTITGAGGGGVVTVGNIVLDIFQDSMIANGTNTSIVRAQVFDLDGIPVPDGTTVTFAVIPIGTIGTTAATSGGDGIATTSLISGIVAGDYHITATAGGAGQIAFGEFISGPAVVANTSLSANPNSIPANEVSTSLITLVAMDANNNPVENDTPVDFYVSSNGGTLSAPSATTLNGVASVILTSSLNSGSITTVTAYVGFYLTAQVGLDTVVGGGIGSGTATDVELTVAPNAIRVKDSGGIESTVITAKAWDETGVKIDDSLCGPPNNIRFEIINGPGGGEELDGVGSVVDKFTQNGSATATLTSGNVSGTVTIQVSITRDGDCDNESLPPNAYATAISTPISIGSGEPANIVIFRDNLVIPNPDGSISQGLSALVQDQHGNPVEDGTSISFGLLDNLNSPTPPFFGYLSAGTNGATASNTAFTSAGATFITDGLKVNDILIVLEGQDEGGHKIASVVSQTQLTLFNTMNTTAPSLDYVAGFATLGDVCTSAITGNLERNGSCVETLIGQPGSIKGVAHSVLTWTPQGIYKPFNLYAESSGGDVGDTLSSSYPAVAPVTIDLVINPPTVLSGDPVGFDTINSIAEYSDGVGNPISNEIMTFSTTNSFLATFAGSTSDSAITNNLGLTSVDTLETTYCLQDQATVEIIAASGRSSGSDDLTILPTAPTALFSCSDNGDGNSATCISSATSPPGITITDYIWDCTGVNSQFVGCGLGVGTHLVTHTVRNIAPDGLGGFCDDSLTLTVTIAAP